MRRFDRERNDTGGGRGFRIIEAGGRYLEPLTPPPPPRAPEPYKVVPSSSSLGRAHRRSSFVIIAETRPATPNSKSTSPTLLQTGRVSPFRGRGFKGPLPHAQSRPQSPEDRQRNGRNNGRYERRASVSQQNSPRRSLIPQPTRRRSVSLTKNNDTTKQLSPKFGRRAQLSRTNANNSSSRLNNIGNTSRRNSLRVPDLSPIQGTPTKPNDTTVGRYRVGNSLVAKVSPVKTRNNLTVPRSVGNTRKNTSRDIGSPGKMANTSKRFVEENRRSVDEETRTKIPTRRGSMVGRNGASNLSTSRFVGKNITKTPAIAADKPKNDVVKRDETETRDNEEISGSSENSRENESTRQVLPATRFIEIDSSLDTKKRENDLGLMELLKQSSGATGTSSVVNTTTTTAVQPLQIEAAAFLSEKDRNNVDEKNSTSLISSASLEPSPSTGLSSSVTSEMSSLPKTTTTTTTTGTTKTVNQATSIIDKKIENRDKEVVGSSSTNNNTSQKISSKLNNDETTMNSGPKKEQNNSTINGQASREKTLIGATGNSRKNLLTRNIVHETSRDETRVTSANPGSRGNNSNNAGNDNQKNTVKQQIPSANKTETNVTMENSISGKPETAGKILEDTGSMAASDNRKSEGRGNVTSHDNGLDGKRDILRNVGGANNGKTTTTTTTTETTTTTTTNNATVPVAANGGDSNNKFRSNNGSDNSLKSSNGLSSVSVESTRSTDTGVSVNTVRGVSSAREKKGMHMMKRSEEIETLSGNVMNHERNGEPAILHITEGNEEPEDQTRLGRFKKSLTRFRDRFTSMRCLGCRKNQKGQSWTGVQQSQTQQRNEPANADSSTNPGNSRCNRMLTSWKNACRCTRLRECKCCRRAARVAPAESTPCCPPERRCGALCGRLFSRCKCNRSEAQNTRSIRAKHSLTSVAPPPLSEEQRVKIPEVLVEHNSVMRGAIPCLPVPIAWFCLVWNVLLPGSGTVWSGLFNLCVGQPRFSIFARPRARFGALVVNLIVGVGQFFTVLFCLVGWGWSIWWGVTMIRLARKYKRFRASEAASSDLEARGGDQTGLPPGVPSQALRGMERAR